jgi:hypothetical protein
VFAPCVFQILETACSPSTITASKAIMRRPLKDPSRLRPTPDSFHCGESIDKGDVGSVTFYFTLNNKRLVFSCRNRSVGALLYDEQAVKDEELEEVNQTVDPNFFDNGYTLAGRTGFQVWAGSRLLLESLALPVDSDCERLAVWQRRIMTGVNVLELGAGVGVVGAALASAGARVLLTDLPTLVDNAVQPNLHRNKETASAAQKEEECPAWLEQFDAMPIGRGWAATTPLDWTRPVESQLSADLLSNTDLIIASDCVWLVSMLTALLDAVQVVFAASPATTAFVMSFQRRDAAQQGGGAGDHDDDDSTLFTTVDRVVAAVEARRWSMECLAWRPAVLDGTAYDDKEVFVLEILPRCRNE